MINGLELISQSYIISGYNFTWTPKLLIALIPLCCAVVAVFMAAKFSRELTFYIFSILFLAVTGMLVVLYGCSEPAAAKPCYTVAITEDLDFDEFNSKYNIEDKDGGYYIITEKD